MTETAVLTDRTNAWHIMRLYGQEKTSLAKRKNTDVPLPHYTATYTHLDVIFTTEKQRIKPALKIAASAMAAKC